MFCKNCGTKLMDNAKFCPDCGSKVEEIGLVRNETIVIQEAEIPLEDKPQYKLAMEYEEKYKKTISRMIIFGIMCIVAWSVGRQYDSMGFWDKFWSENYWVTIILECIGFYGLIISIIQYYQRKKKYNQFLNMNDSEWKQYIANKAHKNQLAKDFGQAFVTEFVKGFVNNL
jgi:hypothetical protein